MTRCLFHHQYFHDGRPQLFRHGEGSLVLVRNALAASFPRRSGREQRLDLLLREHRSVLCVLSLQGIRSHRFILRAERREERKLSLAEGKAIFVLFVFDRKSHQLIATLLHGERDLGEKRAVDACLITQQASHEEQHGGRERAGDEIFGKRVVRDRPLPALHQRGERLHEHLSLLLLCGGRETHAFHEGKFLGEESALGARHAAERHRLWCVVVV